MPSLPAPARPATAAQRLWHWARRAENYLLLLLLALAAGPLLFELGRNPVQLWDESRVAVNAAGMALHGHWLVPYYDGAPDHWNTKPPLLIWLQALDFKLFGLSAWALRLPTALASMGTVLLLYQFAARVLRQPLGGFFGGLILVTCAGYVKLHVARTGDYDALLTFWETLVWVCFFQYLETGRARYLYWVAGGLTAAVLTKTVAGLLGIPGLLLFAVLRGKGWWLLRQPRLYLAAATSLGIIAGYYLAREAADPGYWKAVVYNDISGRYLENQGDNGGDVWYYYFANLKQRTFTPWLWAIGPAILLGLGRRAGVGRRGVLLLLCFAGGWLAVVSSSVSRHDWYDAPMYPALALLVGLGLAVLYQDVLGLYLPRLARWQGLALQVVVLLGLFFGPYRAIIDQLIEERHSNFNNSWEGYLGGYLTTVLHDQPQLDNLTVLHSGNYNAVLTYYQMAYGAQGRRIATRAGAQARTLQPGTVVLLCNPADRVRLDSTFHLMPLHDDDSACQLVLLLPRAN